MVFFTSYLSILMHTNFGGYKFDVDFWVHYMICLMVLLIMQSLRMIAELLLVIRLMCCLLWTN